MVARISNDCCRVGCSAITRWDCDGCRPVLDLERFRKGPIPKVYYVPDWISDAEERAILDRIYSVLDTDADSNKWVTLRGRRLQMWGGEVRVPFRAEPLPRWLVQIAQSLVDAGVFAPERTPNHVLINGMQ